MDLTNIGTLKRLLNAHGLWAKKSLGQHFLVSRTALECVVDAGELTSHDTVIEIGPGCGVLTRELATRAGTVHAVELDRDIIPVLQETTREFPTVQIHQQDIRTFSPPDGPYKVIANIPYYITGKILRFFLEEIRNRPTMLVLMTQKEVAEKISARPPHMNIIATAVQTLGAPEVIATVPATAFYPAPKVDSAVLRIRTSTPPDIDLTLYFRIVRAAFNQPRKQIHNSLAANLQLSPAIVAAWLMRCGIETTQRPGTLTIAQWIALTNEHPALETK